MKLHFLRTRLALAALSLLAVFAGVPAETFAKDAAAPLPATCVPVSRENIGWWKDLNNSFNAISQERSATVVFLGDSITDFWRKAGKAVWEERIAPFDAVNFGISGDKTENVLWRLDNGNLSGKMSPKLVVLMIGTNNWQNKPEDTAQGVKAILEKIKADHPKTKILLLAVFPRGANQADAKRQTNDKLNAIIKKFADSKKQIYWLDINKVFVEKGKDKVLTKEVMPDLLHPSEEGYRRWADAVVPEIRKLLK